MNILRLTKSWPLYIITEKKGTKNVIAWRMNMHQSMTGIAVSMYIPV
jgi:hypothetical protein